MCELTKIYKEEDIFVLDFAFVENGVANRFNPLEISDSKKIN